MTAQEKFQSAVNEACKLHGKTTWGQKHSEHVLLACLAEETGAEAKDLAESEGWKLAKRVINPSAFAQWMEKHVEGFKRETKKEKADSIVKGFKLDME